MKRETRPSMTDRKTDEEAERTGEGERRDCRSPSFQTHKNASPCKKPRNPLESRERVMDRGERFFSPRTKREIQNKEEHKIRKKMADNREFAGT